MSTPLYFENVWPYGYSVSPYIAAICDEYYQVNPIYLTALTNFTGTALEATQYTTRPVLDDCILLGTCLQVGDSDHGDSGQQVFVQIVETETEQYLNSCSIRQGTPSSVFAGLPSGVSPIAPLPEGYFLPKYSRLEHNWRNAFAGFGAVTGGRLTWIGLKLQQPKCGRSPEYVQVNGKKIRVGSRQPWWYSIGVGTEFVNSTPEQVSIIASERYAQYTRQFNYEIEVKGINCNFYTQQGTTKTPEGFLVKLADTGNCEMWTPTQTGLPSMAGAMSQLYSFLPFPQPYVLPRNGKFQFDLINNNNANADQSYVSFSGVKILP